MARGHKAGVSLIYTQTWVGGGVAWLPRENPGVVTKKGGWVLDRWKRQLCISISYVIILRQHESEMKMLLRLGSYTHNSL